MLTSKKNFFQKILIVLQELFHIQLFLTICSLPLLSYWGIRLSLATLIGNILFSPVMSIYLALCIIIFVSEILYIPNGVLIMLFEWYSQSWLQVLSLLPNGIFVTLPHYLLLFYCFTALLACALLIIPRMNQGIRICTYTLLLICSLTPSYFFKTSLSTPLIVPFDGQPLIIKSYQQKLILCCFAALANRGAVNFIRYKLSSKLYSKGIDTIPLVFASSKTSSTYRALLALVETLLIKHLFVVSPSINSKKQNTAFFALQTACQRTNTALHFIDQSKLKELEKYFLSR